MGEQCLSGDPPWTCYRLLFGGYADSQVIVTLKLYVLDCDIAPLLPSTCPIHLSLAGLLILRDLGPHCASVCHLKQQWDIARQHTDSPWGTAGLWHQAISLGLLARDEGWRRAQVATAGQWVTAVC